MKLSRLLTSLSLFASFVSTPTLFFILVFQAQPSYASVSCEGRAVSSSGIKSNIYRETGLTVSDCREKLNNHIARWCLNNPNTGENCTLGEFQSSSIRGEGEGGNSREEGNCATLYSNGDLTGRSYLFDVNHKPKYLGRDFNDRASSAKVKPGYRLTLFEHRDFKGNWVVLRGINQNLGFWNKASSAKCERDDPRTEITKYDRKYANFPNFDVQEYLMYNLDVNNACRGNRDCATNHYLNDGIDEGRRASVFYDPVYYLQANPDVAKIFGSDKKQTLDHYLNNGLKDNDCRNASAEFHPMWYLENNPDVKNSDYGSWFGATRHWFEHGRKEGRKGSP